MRGWPEEKCRGGCGSILAASSVHDADKLCPTCTNAVAAWAVEVKGWPDIFEDWKTLEKFWETLGESGWHPRRFNSPRWLVLVDEWLAAGASQEPLMRAIARRRTATEVAILDSMGTLTTEETPT